MAWARSHTCNLYGYIIILQLLHLVVKSQHLLDIIWQVLQPLDDFRPGQASSHCNIYIAAPPWHHTQSVLTHDEGEHDQCQELAGVCLGAGNAWVAGLGVEL